MPERAPRLRREDCVVLVIDVQDRLVPVMQHPKTLVRRVARLVRGAKALDVPVIHTEQYPKGLGRTVPDIARLLEDRSPIEKMRFSACVPAVEEAIVATGRRAVVVAGIECHVCVLQTCLDLLDAGHTVALPLDATDSRRAVDRDAAVRRLLDAGVVSTSIESVLFEWVRSADGEAFKAVRDIVKDA